MFENVAEFYAREKYSPKTDSFIVAVADDAFKDGAEFGYNNAKEEFENKNVELIGKTAFLENDLNNVKAQIEKLIDFILSKTECCDVCPITDTCINSKGTCPYAGILAKGEEEVTREWLIQFISRKGK